MAEDFYSEPKETEESSSSLKIGEKEYTQEQLEAMISKAQQVDEMESKYNTKFDRVWPEYGKSQSRLKELETELEELRTKAAKPQEPTDLSEEDVQKAREQAKRLGIVTEDQFGEYMSKQFRQYYEQERSAERIIEQGQKLEGELDGQDGRPKFVLTDVLEYMRDNQLPASYGLDRAYRDKYEKELDAWKIEQFKRHRAEPFVTQEARAGSKQPDPIKPTESNIYDLVKEGLGDY